MPDVIFYEAFREEEAALKEYLPKEISAEYTWKTIQAQGSDSPSARLISVRTQSVIPESWSGSIDGILTRSQGYDQLTAYKAQTGTKALCGYLDDYCSRAVAEGAIMAMLNLLRKYNAQIEQFKNFCRDGLTGEESRGKKALVVGVGKIGAEIVDMARGLRMEVRGVDVNPTIKDLQYVELNEGLTWAEIIICALPLNKETDSLLDEKSLRQAGKGVYLINVSRGEITPAEGLKNLLNDGHLGGLALDVYEEESQLSEHLRGGAGKVTKAVQSILDLKNDTRVIFTPHNAFNTKEALRQKGKLSAEAIVQFLKTKEFPFCCA